MEFLIEFIGIKLPNPSCWIQDRAGTHAFPGSGHPAGIIPGADGHINMFFVFIEHKWFRIITSVIRQTVHDRFVGIYVGNFTLRIQRIAMYTFVGRRIKIIPIDPNPGSRVIAKPILIFIHPVFVLIF